MKILKKSKDDQNEKICFIWIVILTLKLKKIDRSIFLAISIIDNFISKNWSLLKFLL